ncbi:MAG: prenyltransferase/squalene oxidase repeat-containing protein [Planctomycetota bacterium]
MTKLNLVISLFICGLVLIAGSAAFAEDAENQQDNAQKLKDRIDPAVKKACEFLKNTQLGDGSWDYLDQPFELNLPGVEGHLVEGCTALCVYTLLKGGESPKSPAVQKAVAFMRSRPFKHVYSVACYVLALSALYTTDSHKAEDKEISSEEKIRTTIQDDPAADFRKKAAPQDKKMVIDAVDWLVKNQQANVWRYPQHGEDTSNTQYVMLAFNEAQRLGIPIPISSCLKTAQFFVKHQEESGPEVEWFPVPAADVSIRNLRKLEKEIRKEIGKIEKELKKDKDKERADGLTTSVLEDARDKIFSGEKKKMFARGWCYMPIDPANQEWRKEITGSMTTSGIISLTVCKSVLEGTPEYSADFSVKVDQAIRDGCAWIAHKFTVTTNPTKSGDRFLHHYYYLYGLERAGALTLVFSFGTHNWYKEGAELILSQQQDDGSWIALGGGTSGPIPDTCFAILFLKKATTPIVNVPETPTTGGDLFNDPKDKK